MVILAFLVLLSGGCDRADDVEAVGSPEDVHLAQKAWSEISCAIFGSYSEDDQMKAESQGLYFQGVRDLRQFLTSARNGTISVDAMRENVPVGFSLEMRSNWVSTDFMAGRLYSMIEEHATDKIFKYQESERAGEYRATGLWPIEAAILFRNSNCSSLVER